MKWDIKHEGSKIVATPREKEMEMFIQEGAKFLQMKCALKEEEMILGASPTETLIRIRDFCNAEIVRRGMK